MLTLFQFKIIEYKSDLKFRKIAKKLMIQETTSTSDNSRLSATCGRRFINNPIIFAVGANLVKVTRQDIDDRCQVCSHNTISQL